jgi:thymidylate synthase ThyX
MPVLTGAPRVTLRHAAARPYDAAIAAARTCYSPRVIGSDEVTPQQRDTIGPLTFEGGHHTVFQHAHFEFGLENVSRQFVWSFLHSHEAAIESAWESYRRLNALLRVDTLRIVGKLRHLTPTASEKRRRKIEREAEKKAIETARYVIPLAAFTSMVHTLSGIVLHRLHRMMRTGDAPEETRAVVEAMVGLVKQLDPAFFERVGQGPLPDEDVVEARLPRFRSDGDAEAVRLDALLGARVSLLVDHMPQAEATTAEAVRTVVGADPRSLSDDEALERLLNPGRNRYRLETLQLSVHSPLARAMHHASYTFLKKLSHTADSQDQRHRMVPGSRPLMTLTDTRRPDCVTPPLVAANPEALAVYQEAMDRAWAAKNRLLEMDVPLEAALYVLPNAKALRFHETGSLLYLAHKWVMRTCFNAQEEIYRASIDELEQVRALHPRLARHMGPPCVLRHGRITPTCTEGEHFCGVPVWRSFPDVVRPL